MIAKSIYLFLIVSLSNRPKNRDAFHKKMRGLDSWRNSTGTITTDFWEMSFIDGLAERFLMLHQEQPPKRFNEKALEEKSNLLAGPG